MSFGLMDVFVKIGADTSELNSGLDSAESSVNGFTSILGGVAKVGVGALATLGTTIAGSSAAFVSAAGDVASYGDNIDKMSQKMGISAEAYQEWDAIMQHSGTSIEALKPSMKTLANAVEKNSDAFQKLGISEQEVASLSQEDLFARVISGLQGMEEGTERTYLTSQLLGRGATELGALLNTSAEDTEAMRQRVHELGGVMSDEAVKASAAYQDSLQDMTTAFDGLKRGLVSEFLPSITTVMDGLTNLFIGDSQGLGQIKEGISGFINNLSSALPKVIDTGTEIINSLLEAITENAPQLVKAGVDAILNFVQGIISNGGAMVDSAVQIINEMVMGITDALPALAEGGLQILTGLAKGISEMLPTLIPTIVEVMLQIVQTLIENIPLLIDAALQLLQGLAEGLIASLPVLIEMIPKIIDSLVKALVNGLPQLILGGVKLLEGIANALPTIIQSLINALPKVIDAVVKGLMSALPALIQGHIQMTMAIVKAMPQIIKALIAEIPTIVDTVVSTLIDNMPIIIEGLVEMTAMIVAELPSIIMAIIKIIPSLVTSIANAILAVASTIINAVGQILSQVGQALVQKGSEFVSTTGEKMSELYNKVIEWLGKLPERMAYWAGYAAASFIKFIAELPGKVRTEFNNVMTNVRSFATEFVNKAKEMAKDFFESIVNKIQELPGKMQQFGTDLLNAIKGLPDQFKSIGSDIVSGIWNGISSGWDWLVGQVGNLAQSLYQGAKDKLGIKSPSKKFMYIGEMMDKGLASGINQSLPDVRRAMEGLNGVVDAPNLSANYSVVGSADAISSEFSTASMYESDSPFVSDMVDAFVKALDRYGLTVEVDNRELGRVVRREVLA